MNIFKKSKAGSGRQELNLIIAQGELIISRIEELQKFIETKNLENERLKQNVRPDKGF